MSNLTNCVNAGIRPTGTIDNDWWHRIFSHGIYFLSQNALNGSSIRLSFKPTKFRTIIHKCDLVTMCNDNQLLSNQDNSNPHQNKNNPADGIFGLPMV